MCTDESCKKKSARLSAWTISLLHLHQGSMIQKHGFSYHCYTDDTQLYLSFQPDYPAVAAYISACLTDISGRTKDHYLQLILQLGCHPLLHQGHPGTLEL